jgi:hypothetical protein
MTAKVYLTQAVNESLPSIGLSEDQLDDLNGAFAALSQGDTLDSRIIFADDTPGGGLRELDRKNLRIFFRLDPQNGTVMIADIRPKSDLTPATTPHAEKELAASS